MINELLVTTMLACSAAAGARSVIYEPIDGERGRFDEIAHRFFDGAYDVIDIQQSEHSWVAPQAKTSTLSGAVMKDNKCLAGTAFVIYVVNHLGKVEGVHVNAASNDDLAPSAISRISAVTFKPATLDGRPVGAVAVGKLDFDCP